MSKYLVLDTNILLLEANNLLQLSTDNVVVLPETVIDELDSKKGLLNELGYQARQFGRLLSQFRVITTDKMGDMTVTKLALGDYNVEIASFESYPQSVADSESSVRNDRQIIHVAKYYNELLQDVEFMSNDVMARLRAIPFGVQVTDLKEVEEVDLQFTKDLEVDSSIFSSLNNSKIFLVDPDYSYENFNYRFSCSKTGQVKLGTVYNGFVYILGKTTEKELRAQEINPMNSEQLFFSKAIQDTNIDIVLCEAKAGSGKSLVAISNAINSVRLKKYQGILYVRNSVDDVEKAEEVGFLPGLEEKFAVYLHPLGDCLDFIVRNKYKASKLKGEEFEKLVEEKTAEMRTKYNIESHTGLGMRGRTFHDTIIIIDEAQNLSASSMQKVLTRVGKNCKVIIIGSNRQIDNPYLTKYTNGLSVVIDATSKEQGTIKLHAVELHKVVRSDIAEFAESLFE